MEQLRLSRISFQFTQSSKISKGQNIQENSSGIKTAESRFSLDFEIKDSRLAYNLVFHHYQIR